ncbi:hypothetical protein [Microbacterium sp. SORGH_AS_0862]|uniref:hypothetical protein n=1 Tax=Microbacterium sp. SORGH_AS_0862 TaxID=3041789 RepID=UPI002792745E|nr:hypothetical protein [Microbacterium sp. SORGH_AS_0862]MDQ1204643.1 hypothetical protein [Microbacterium sp. SORGH_AS_0862]
MSGEVQRPFGARTTALGVSVGGGIARQSRRETEQVAANADVMAMAEQGAAFLHSVALSNVATLVSQAEAYMKVAPAGGAYYEAIIANYAITAGQRLSRGLG